MWEHALLECKGLVSVPANLSKGHNLTLANLPGKTCAHCEQKIVGLIGQAYRFVIIVCSDKTESQNF